MTTNSYFNNYSSASEQEILEDLIIESIKIYGQDMIYLPRQNNNPDDLYGTSDLVTFSTHYPIEMYLTSVDGFAGDGDFMSKFGLEIRDQIVLSVARKRFSEEITNLPRPREGDLIYFPLNDKCFEIRFVNNKKLFYQLGSLPMYELTCELYEYSSEKFETGISAIDKIYTNRSLDISALTSNGVITSNTITNTDAKFELNKIFDDSAQIKREDDFIDFTEFNPFSERRP
jgi:hypothetical protein